MDRIRSFVRHARFRMHLQALLSAALAALPFTAALVALLVLERRLLGASSAIGVPSRSMAWLALAVLAAAAAAAAYGWWRARAVRPTDDAVAIELDARVRTGERFSTALALEADASAAADPFARAAIADAVRHASDPDGGEPAEAHDEELGPGAELDPMGLRDEEHGHRLVEQDAVVVEVGPDASAQRGGLF